MVAKLPCYLKERTLSDLAVNQSGWVTPWTMEVADDDSLWIRPQATMTTFGGTVCLQITRLENGWLAELHTAQYVNGRGDRYRFHPAKYSPSELQAKGYEPVVEFVDRQDQ